MLKLSLLRHAKSSWDDPELEDFDRPLAKRGAKAAPKMGAFIAAEDLKPDLVLCSGAVRARATLALILPELGVPPPEVSFEDDLYLCVPAVMLDRLRKVKKSVHHVMIIGHNPGLHALALELTGDGDREAMAALATGFPTAALAVFTLKAESWSEIRSASGKLEQFITPRTLA